MSQVTLNQPQIVTIDLAANPDAAVLPTAEAQPAMSGGPVTDILTDHAYDGIQEYDNPMPGWWKWLFVGTIVFSIVYYLLSFISGWFSPVTVYEQAKADELRLQNAKPLTETPASLLAYSKDDKVRAAGASVFAANCAICHKPDGSGQVGPNLTDEVYLNIRAIEDIPKFIRSGAKNGAMPSFARLPANEILRAAAFVASLRGKNLPGKPPEGIPIPPWGSAAPASQPTSQPIR